MNRSLYNVVQLGLGFFAIFSAFNSCGLIQETVISNFAKSRDIGPHDGYVSLSIVYAVFTFANFFAPPFVNFFGAKWAMVAAGSTYAIFQLGFLNLNKIFLYFSSALLGFGAAVIWTAQGKYLSLNSTSGTAGKHSGIFWATSQCCLVFGGIFLFFVFHFSGDGHSISLTTLRILYSVFTCVTVIGIAILAFLNMPNSGEEIVEPLERSNSKGLSQMLVATLKLTRTKGMLALIVVFCYTGIELSFWSGIYSTCIASTLKLSFNTNSLLALNTIALGLGQAISGFFFGILGSKTGCLGRHRIVFLGAFVHLITYIAIFINFPSDASLGKTDNVGLIDPSITIAIVCGFLLGFGDACWNTQVFALLISRYTKRSAEAFSIFKFFQSLLACATFYCSKIFHLQYHLLILTVGLVAGSIAFYFADVVFHSEVEENNSEESENETVRNY